MPDVQVTFVHPTDGRVMTVTVDDTMTAQEAVGELVANNFLTPLPQGYELHEGDKLIRSEQTLSDAGVKNSSKIRLVPAAEAGARQRR